MILPQMGFFESLNSSGQATVQKEHGSFQKAKMFATDDDREKLEGRSSVCPKRSPTGKENSLQLYLFRHSIF